MGFLDWLAWLERLLGKYTNGLRAENGIPRRDAGTIMFSFFFFAAEIR